MANNRMYLRHKPSGKRVYLAKYYPSTGWYMTRSAEDVNADFDAIEFAHLTSEQKSANDAHVGLGAPYPSLGGMLGDDWELEYESTSDETVYTKEGEQ